MAMTWVWTGMVVLSLLFGLINGTLDAVASAAMGGAQSAVELSISMAGILCLWSGVMEVMRVCGLSDGLARAFRPLLRRLMPQASRDSETLAAVSANLSANFLGLGNAATPLGIQAARRMARGCGGIASDELCLLVLSTTSRHSSSLAESPVTSCACWWCSTPRLSSCCPPRWPPSVPPPAARLPSTSCRRYGSPPSCRFVPAS